MNLAHKHKQGSQVVTHPLFEQYRPATWDEVVGQRKVLDQIWRAKALRAAADSGVRPSANTLCSSIGGPPSMRLYVAAEM